MNFFQKCIRLRIQQPFTRVDSETSKQLYQQYYRLRTLYNTTSWV